MSSSVDDTNSDDLEDITLQEVKTKSSAEDEDSLGTERTEVATEESWDEITDTGLFPSNRFLWHLKYVATNC
jgi:hypothetical protein